MISTDLEAAFLRCTTRFLATIMHSDESSRQTVHGHPWMLMSQRTLRARQCVHAFFALCLRDSRFPFSTMRSPKHVGLG